MHFTWCSPRFIPNNSQGTRPSRYVCAPNFWEDLRSTLQAIEQRRDERAGKLKAQQVPVTTKLKEVSKSGSMILAWWRWSKDSKR